MVGVSNSVSSKHRSTREKLQIQGDALLKDLLNDSNLPLVVICAIFNQSFKIVFLQLCDLVQYSYFLMPD